MSDLIDRAALRAAVNRIPLWSPHPDIKDSVSGKWTMAANDVLDAIEWAAPRAATEPPPPDMSNDIKLVANAILGSTSYLPHREAAERLLAAPRAATEPPLTRERLAAALPHAVNFHFLPPRVVKDPIWLEVADAILEALATLPSAQEPT